MKKRTQIARNLTTLGGDVRRAADTGRLISIAVRPLGAAFRHEVQRAVEELEADRRRIRRRRLQRTLALGAVSAAALGGSWRHRSAPLA